MGSSKDIVIENQNLVLQHNKQINESNQTIVDQNNKQDFYENVNFRGFGHLENKLEPER